ncbi:terminase small subunit [Desulfuromonas sp. KJ2020]|uniref:terminase small subunit n=1 Tax=Desulfuromonas sp. KJ2020 TaxID=2919173 RepID=UPI0035318400
MAAIRAGYSERTAAQQGARLLRKVKVKEVIDKGMPSRAIPFGVVLCSFCS